MSRAFVRWYAAFWLVLVPLVAQCAAPVGWEFIANRLATFTCTAGRAVGFYSGSGYELITTCTGGSQVCGGWVDPVTGYTAESQYFGDCYAEPEEAGGPGGGASSPAGASCGSAANPCYYVAASPALSPEQQAAQTADVVALGWLVFGVWAAVWAVKQVARAISGGWGGGNGHDVDS